MSAWQQVAIWLAVFVALVVASGFFSGISAAAIALNRFQMRQRSQNRGNERARRVVALFSDIQEVLAVSLIGTTLANVAAVLSLIIALRVALGLTGRPLDWATAALALLIAVPVLLTLGEVAPRRLFREHADRIVFWLYRPIRWSLMVLHPLAAAGLRLTRWILRRAGSSEMPPQLLAKSEPWQSLIVAESEAGSPPAGKEPSETRMIHGIFDLQKTRAREVMRPLVDLVAIRALARVGDLRQLARRTGYSRFPLYHERITDLVGYVDIYDVLVADPPDDAPIDPYVREAFYVPETKRLDDLLQEMLHEHHKVAIVVDEHGGCSGWVTREDLLEEIVGEIEDEFDRTSEPIRKIDECTYLVLAAMDVHDLDERLGVRLPPGEYDTLGGFVYDALGRIPQVGDSFEKDGVRFEVAEMDERRIISVRITLRAAPSNEQ